MTQARQATLCDINRILGISGPIDPENPNSVQVTGIHPLRITTSELTVTQKFSLLGSFDTKVTLPVGTAADPCIKFVGAAAGTGIYAPSTGGVSVSIGGTDKILFADDGVHVTDIFSPSGVIDFHGSAVANVTGWTPSQWSKTVAMTDMIVTTDDTPTVLLTIPTTAITEDYCVALMIKTHVTAVRIATDIVFDKTFENMVFKLGPDEVVDTTIDQPFNINQYLSDDTSTILPVSFVDTGASSVALTVAGVAATNISWMASCNIQRTEYELVPRP